MCWCIHIYDYVRISVSTLPRIRVSVFFLLSLSSISSISLPLSLPFSLLFLIVLRCVSLRMGLRRGLPTALALGTPSRWEAVLGRLLAGEISSPSPYRAPGRKEFPAGSSLIPQRIPPPLTSPHLLEQRTLFAFSTHGWSHSSQLDSEWGGTVKFAGKAFGQPLLVLVSSLRNGGRQCRKVSRQNYIANVLTPYQPSRVTVSGCVC